MVSADASLNVPAPRHGRIRSGSLGRAAVLVCLVGFLSASAGGLAAPAAPAAKSPSWSQLPLAARGPIAAAVASHDPHYRLSRATSGLTARNPAQGLRLRFSAAGVGVQVGAQDIRLALRTVGRGPVVRRLEAVAPQVIGPNRTVYRHPDLAEWYANSPLGLEQGFTLSRRPAGHGALTFTVGLSGSLAAGATQHGQTVSFGSLVYRGLIVTDARGHRLPAHVQLTDGLLAISVTDRNARYPVRVDPFLQNAQLTASDGAAYDTLGASVAVSGNTIAASAPFRTVGSHSNQGAVYVFTKPAGGWADATQTAELTASDGAAGDDLGWNVAVSGDTIVAGAIQHTVGGKAGQGAVYVFTKPSGGWTNATQTAELTASDGAAHDNFGWSVAVSTDTVVAGSPVHSVGGNSSQGGVYVFAKPGGGWANATQTAELTASDGAASDQLGSSVSLSADTVVAGSPFRTVGGNTFQGAVYVFTKPAGGWTDGAQTAELTASDGAAYDDLGSSVAVSGGTVVAGAPLHTVGGHDQQGAVYVYTVPGGGWTNGTQTAELTASDGAASDELGSSVAASGGTVAAGAPQHSVGANGAQGAVYAYTKPIAGWVNATQTAELTASDGAGGDQLGSSVAVSGSTIAAGAPLRTEHAQPGEGASYVFSSGLTISTTQQPASATVGSAIADKATVTGNSPTGTVTFELYDNPTATGSPLFSDTKTLSAGSATSSGYTTTAPGTYYWVATYNGDINNAALSSGTADEPVVVKASPLLTTTQKPQSSTVGSSIADQATVTGSYSPTGTVTFRLYSNASATGSPLYTDTKPLSSGIALSGGYPTTAAGTYYWVATYNGDANNFAVAGSPADEPVSVAKATPSISTTQQPATAGIGSSIADHVTVSGGYNPSGTVTFRLYDNAGATGSPLFSDTKTLSSGSATSGGYATTATGTYYWVATYNGDANNNTIASGTAEEPVTVTMATPSISVTPSPATAAIGSSIAAQATVTSGYSPTGTVTFKLYDNPNATGPALFTDAKSVSSGSATSGGYVPPSTGTYYWVASYGGDANNGSASSGTAAAPVTVSTATPSISTTQQPTTASVGSSIVDTATVSGGHNPTGTVTFKLYNNPDATGTAVFTDTEPLANGGATSAGYATTLAGTYYWVATYSGDSDNVPVGSGTADEPVTVTKLAPSIAGKRRPASAKVGKRIGDMVVVSGGYLPTGTVTFRLYKKRAGVGKPVLTSTKSLVHGRAVSAPYKPKAPGKYYWVATYNGDGNNTSVSTPKTSQRVSVHR
jgi:hypothetical protein